MLDVEVGPDPGIFGLRMRHVFLVWWKEETAISPVQQEEEEGEQQTVICGLLVIVVDARVHAELAGRVSGQIAAVVVRWMRMKVCI